MDECLSFVVSTGLSKGNFACIALILSHIKLFQMWVLLSKSIKIKSFSYETVKKNNDFFCPRMVVYYLMYQSSSNLKMNNNKQAKLHLDACSSFLFNSPFSDTLTLVGFFLSVMHIYSTFLHSWISIYSQWICQYLFECLIPILPFKNIFLSVNLT